MPSLNFIFRSLLTIMYAAGVFFLSSRPIKRLMPFIGIDKLEHAVAYGGLALLIAWALSEDRIRTKIKDSYVPLISILTATLYGAANEIYQIFVPRRCPDVMDAYANFLGACLAMIIYLFAISTKPTAEGNR
jgi:VanZ family protein